MIKVKICIFTSYSEYSNAYKLYNHVTKKTIIRRDVVSKEKESWIGMVDKKFEARVPLMQEEDVAEKEQQKSQEKTQNIVTLARTPRFFEQCGSSSRSTDQNFPTNMSSDESRNGKRKMRSLKYIYDDLDVSLVQFFHCCFSNLLHFNNLSEMKTMCKPWMKKLNLFKIMIHEIWFIFLRIKPLFM